MKKIQFFLLLGLFVFGNVYSQEQIQFPGLPLEEFNGLPLEIQEDLQKYLYNEANEFIAPINKSAKIGNPLNSFPSVSKPKGIAGDRQNSMVLLKSLNQENSKYYREKLDSIEYYEPIFLPVYDSLNTVAETYKIDENGYIIEQIRKALNPETNEWEFQYKMVFQNDANGKPVERIDFGWYADKWKQEVKHTYEYDGNGNILLFSSYNYDPWSESYNIISWTEYLYDENNRLLIRKSYDTVLFGKEVILNKRDNTYNANGEEVYYSYCTNWDMNLQTWRFQIKSYKEYNEQNDILSQTDSLFNSNTLEWELRRKDNYEFAYLEDGSVQRTTYALNVQTGDQYLKQQEHYKIEKQYEGDKLIEEIRYLADGSGGWMWDWKNEYRYDQWGNEIFYGNYKAPFSSNEWELMSRREKVFSEEGKLLKEEVESFIMDYEIYAKKGTQLYHRTYDQNGRILSQIYYKWDDNGQEWLFDQKILRTEKADQEYEMKTFTFNKNGTRSEFEHYYATIFDYDEESGLYTRIREMENGVMGYWTDINYNENRKIVSYYSYNNYMNRKGEIYYDESGRDTAWYSFRKVDDQWQLEEKQTFAYNNLGEGIVRVTERRIGVYNSSYKYDYYYTNDTLVSRVEKRYDENTGMWMAVDSTLYVYNNHGQLVQILKETGEYHSKTEFQFRNDTLTMCEYSINYPEQDWSLKEKSVYEINSTVSKDQIQPFPAVFTGGNSNTLIFNSQFDYGKVISETYYYYPTDGPERVQGKSLWYFSGASSLSGEAVISGYVYEGSGSLKSISITEETGIPVAGAVVSLVDRGDDFVLATDTTSADGYYEFKGVPNGNFYLRIELAGYTQASTYELEVSDDLYIFENKNFIVQNGELVTHVEELKMDIKIYPNPASEYIHIKSPYKMSKVKITDMSGKLTFIENSISQEYMTIPLKTLNGGMYILEIHTGLGSFREKFIIQHF